MEPVLFPQLLIADPVIFWNSASENGDWWQLFYAKYERFIYNYADLAQIMGAKAIILGDPAVSLSMIRNDQTQEEWYQIVKGVRARFSGTIIGAFSVPNTDSPPDWLNDTDLIYALFSPTIIDSGDVIKEMSDQLDSLVFPLKDEFSKPIIIGASFMSDYETNQASLYNAISVSAFSKPWITGMVTRNYYPFLLLNDNGPSPYGKPANDILWFWFHFIQNLS
jgi:hypothetical protein